MAVPPEVVDEIRNRVDIVRIIGEVMPLKKTGRNFVGLCPFHQEKTASFSVSDAKQLYHCFGCGEGGTVITFVMKYHHLTFPEALERLAPLSGIDLTQYQKESQAITAQKELKKKLVRATTYARDFYHRVFLESPEAEKARVYTKSRGISLEDAKELKLGFAPEGWQALVDLFNKHQFSLEDARSAGLIQKKAGENRYYDLFRDRLLFSISDTQGNCVGFGGRVLGEGNPKYLNSPQTPIFDKGKLLYGIYEAEDAIRASKHAILVEGYMDQVALKLSGISHVVATLGTALTDSHVRLLRKYTDEVIVVFDGDEAGLKAARRSIRPLLSQGLRAKVVVLPGDDDPDTFIQKNGKETFLQLIKESSSILDFFLDRYISGERDISKKAQAISELADVVIATESDFLKEAIVDEASRKTGFKKEVFRGEERLPLPSVRSFQPKTSTEEEFQVSLEILTLLRLSTESPMAREKLLASDTLELFSDRLFSEVARKWVEQLSPTTSDAPVSDQVDRWEDEKTRPQLAKIFFESIASDGTKWEQVWENCMKKLRMREIRRLSEAVQEADQRGDNENVLMLMRKMEELKKLEQRF